MTPDKLHKFIKSFEYSDQCWKWVGTEKHLGYGEFYIGGKSTPAHRVSYELFKGKIPDGLVIDHLCRNPRCVNPAHLEAVTNVENIMRGEGVGAKAARKTVCDYGHPLVGDNVWLRRRVNGRVWRKCRACAARVQAEYRKRKGSN